MKYYRIISTVLAVILFFSTTGSFIYYLLNLAYSTAEYTKVPQTMYSVNNVETDKQGNFYVGDNFTNSIQVFDSKGNYKYSIMMSQSFNFRINKNNELMIMQFSNFDKEFFVEYCNCSKIAPDIIFTKDTAFSYNLGNEVSDYEKQKDEFLNNKDNRKIEYKRRINGVVVNNISIVGEYFPIPYQILLLFFIFVLFTKIIVRIIFKVRKKYKKFK